MQDKQNKWRLRSINVAAYASTALIYHLVFLTNAFQYGPLVELLPWDDCSYIYRGLRNAHFFLTANNPLHFILRSGLNFKAPLADMQTFLGLVLFNFNYFLTYLLGFVHTLALLLFLDYYFRDSKGFLKYGIMLLALSLPIVQWFPPELKSDYKGGMYLMMALLLLFESGYSNLDWKRAGIISAAFTLASLAKVTAVYIPLYCLGVLGLYWLFHLYRVKIFCEGEDMQPTGNVLKLCLMIGAAFLCTYLIIVLPDIKSYFSYIKFALSPKWHDKFTLTKHLLYYTPFGGSSRAWSPYWYILLLFAPLSLHRAYKTHRESFLRLSGLFLATAVLFLPLLVTKTHIISYGSYFYFAVFGCFLVTVQFLVISFSVKPFAANSLVAISWFAIIICVLFQPKIGHGYALFPKEINLKRNEIVTEIARQIHEHGGERKVVWLFQNALFPYRNIQIRYYQMYHKFFEINRIDMFQNIDKALNSADFVLALDNSKAKYLNKRKTFTSNQHASEVLAIMKNKQNFKLIEKYGILNFNVHLFKSVKEKL
jgi:ribosomal protein L14E/L6E/L27E